MASRGSTSSTNGLLPPLSNHDEEAGPGKAFDDDGIDPLTSDPFDIAHTKNAPLETLRRWRYFSKGDNCVVNSQDVAQEDAVEIPNSLKNNDQQTVTCKLDNVLEPMLYKDEILGRREISNFQEPEEEQESGDFQEPGILEDGINKFSEERTIGKLEEVYGKEIQEAKNGQMKNDEFIDPYPKIETLELKKVHPVLKQDDEALNFSTEIEAAIFKKTSLILENAVILVNHQPFDEIPQPSLVKLGKSEPIFVNKLEIRRDMFCEYDWWVFKARWKIEKLQEAEQAALVLNASRRFRYTLDLNKEEEKEQRRRMIRAHAQVIRAALLFRLAGERQIVLGPTATTSTPTGDYAVSLEQLASMTRDHNISALQEYGGVKGLSELLETNLDKGINGDETDLLRRRKSFGSNSYPRKKGRSFFRFLWEAWQDLTLIILIIAAVVSLTLGIKTEGLKEGWYDGGSIAFAVFLVIIVTAVSDYRQSLQFQNLNQEKQNILLEVLRGGRTVKISIFDIVVGDVVPLKIGDQVPADGILIAGHSLAIDESSMTGESKTVHKDQKAPFLMSGCKVADGVGTMLVTGVGINTEWGLLMASISEDTGEETPLQVRLNGIATFIGIVGLSVAVFVLAVLLVRYFTGYTKNPEGEAQFVHGKTSVSSIVDGVIKIFTIAVTIVVVAVPEGLPLAVTLTLAYSMRKMMADKALVRRLSACETMGSATTICSDKTGTLTQNQMTVVEAYVGRKRINPLGDSWQLHPVLSSLLVEGIAQNTIGNVFVPKGGGGMEVSGSPTEKAILSWAIKLGMNFDLVRSESVVLHVFPFNSEKKRGGVAVKRNDFEVHIHWKGAAEIVLASCTGYLDSSGCLQSIEEDKEVFKAAIDDMAASSLRCVAIAYRSYELDKVPTDEEHLAQWVLPEDDLVLLAIVGIKDPCRPGVKEAVKVCTEAGVKVRMVTGDNLRTAKAIALECGILATSEEATEPTIIEGRAFRELSEKEREQVAKKVMVMGRSSPNDKLLLVQALRTGGEVVAVTGDGTNDAPALHEADIGLSMGIQGTEVAKESSDIIILDDDFASVVKVVRWGRSVYANIQKFIQFQLTVNVAALVINVVAAVSSGDVPLNAVQLLWVNLIMDTLGALALATEPPTDHLMHRSPVGRREPLVTNIMWRNILVQALYQVIVLLVLNFRGRNILHLNHDNRAHAVEVKNTMIFNAFVLCQIFNEFNARKPDEINVFTGVTRNYLFMGIVGITFVLQIIIIEFLGKFASTVKLSWKQWLITIAIGVLSWPLAMIGKLIPVPETPFGNCFQRCTTARNA